MLNERGVFDAEIEVVDAEFLEDIKEDSPIYVKTEYFEVEDCRELANEPIIEDELKRLSLYEVDEILGEIENDCDNEEYEDIEGSYWNQAMKYGDEMHQVIGIKPINVYAKTVSNSSSYLKKTLILSNTTLQDGKNYIKVSYTNYWIKPPVYRNKDVVILDFEGAFYDASSVGSSCRVKRSYHKEEYRYYYSSKLKTNYKEKVYSKDVNYTVRQGYIAAEIDLKNDVDACHANIITVVKEYSDIVKYSNETIGINLYLKRDTRFDGATFYGIYEHFKSKTNVAGIVIDTINKNVCSLIYSTASGDNVSEYCTYAGKEFQCTYYVHEFK